MALNTYLTLKLDGTQVNGDVTQKGRENTIEVTSFELTYDSDGLGEVKFTAALDPATVPIHAGLKNGAVVDALFDFYAPSASGTETKYFTLHGTNGQVRAANIWMLNNKDPNLMRYETTMQYAMSFTTIVETFTNGGLTVTLP